MAYSNEKSACPVSLEFGKVELGKVELGKVEFGKVEFGGGILIIILAAIES